MFGERENVLRDQRTGVEIDILFNESVFTKDLETLPRLPPLKHERNPHLANPGDRELHVPGHIFNQRTEGF